MVFGTRLDAHLPALENLLPALGVHHHGAFADANRHLPAFIVSIRPWVFRREQVVARLRAGDIVVVAALSIYVLVSSMPVVVGCIPALHAGLKATDWAGRMSVRRASKVDGG